MSQSPTFKFAATAAALASAPTVRAQAAAEAAGSGTFFGELVSILVPLVLIILVLLAGLHLARRRYGMTGQDAPLSVVQILPLGPRERIVLLRTRAGRVFAVGVAAQSVSLVTELEASDLAPSSEASQPAAAPLRRPTLFGKPLIRRDFSG